MADESATTRNLIIVLGDQLDADSSAFDGFDNVEDAVLMMELAEEATYIPQHKQRLVLFFAAMRHFKLDLEQRGRAVHYVTLDDANNRGTFEAEVSRWLQKLQPARLVLAQPGDHRVLLTIQAVAKREDIPLQTRPDRHFFASRGEFEAFAHGRRKLLMEDFYRHMRREHDVLMNGKQPRGDRWNFDADNRKSFGKDGPGLLASPLRVKPDRITRDVMTMVQRRFPDHPGNLANFDHAVTREQAKSALADFIAHRLPLFGTYQDAMTIGEPYLYHSLLSSALNLHLLDPRDVVNAAVSALDADEAPLNAVEGFVRQMLGWREYIRGVYWLQMPGYADLNVLQAELAMPAFMWTADTDMRCVRDGVEHLVEHAYTHHIQRLMVLGLFALLLGVHPYRVHRWHMAMYIDAVDWVSLPNVLGMSQYGDGGLVGTKPYCASGNYIKRMSNYCANCRYHPGKSVGEDACPITTLYWDFLIRHRAALKSNGRMGFQLRNVERKSNGEQRAIRKQAESLKSVFAGTA